MQSRQRSPLTDICLEWTLFGRLLGWLYNCISISCISTPKKLRIIVWPVSLYWLWLLRSQLDKWVFCLMTAESILEAGSLNSKDATAQAHNQTLLRISSNATAKGGPRLRLLRITDASRDRHHWLLKVFWSVSARTDLAGDGDVQQMDQLYVPLHSLLGLPFQPRDNSSQLRIGCHELFLLCTLPCLLGL